jgi:putative tricarboxylic transport membrane protein
MSIETPAPAAAPDERPVVASRSVDIVVSLLLFGLAVLLGFDSWRVGMSWADDGPQAGYFPFYLSVLMGAASLFGLARAVAARPTETFVNRDQARRVVKVLGPTIGFVLLIQVIGLYVASFLLVAGFMIWVGRIAPWKSLLVAAIFSTLMFSVFEIAFNVIMPKGPLEAFLGY